jgi:hypothetical protein
MKLYNPILGGKSIKLESNATFDKDQSMEFENGEEMLKKYPFLVNLESPEMIPDACNDTRNIPMKEWYSGRATSRLSDELKSITDGVTKYIKEVQSVIETTHDNMTDDISRISVRLSSTNNLLEEISQIVSQTQEINTKILEELIFQRESKFSFKKLFKR